MQEKLENGYVKVGVSQKELEDSIVGLKELKPILQRQVILGNGANVKQATIDGEDIGRHFDTAITSMTMLLAGFDDYK